MATAQKLRMVQKQLRIKPWHIAKNASKIVGKCVNNMYKKKPSANPTSGPKTSANIDSTSASKAIDHTVTKSDAQAAPREENKGPLRLLRSLQKLRQNKNAAVDRAKEKSRSKEELMDIRKNLKPINVNRTVPVENKINFAKNAAIKMKYKNSHDSAGDSNNGVFRYDSLCYKSGVENNKVLARNQEAELPRKNTIHNLNNYIPTRNQHMTIVKNRHQEATKALKGFSKVFKSDLMQIDSITKNRIAYNKASPGDAELANDPMHKWKHPPADQLLNSRNERNILHFEVIEQQRRLQELEMERQTKLLQKLNTKSSATNSYGVQRSIKKHSDPFSICTKPKPSKSKFYKTSAHKKTKPVFKARAAEPPKAVKILRNKMSALSSIISNRPKPNRSNEGRFNHIGHLNRPNRYIHTSAKQDL